MKLNELVSRRIISLSLAAKRIAIIVLSVCFLCLARTTSLVADPTYVNLPNQPPLVRIKATILDNKHRPLTGAAFEVFDAAHQPLESPDAVSYVSDTNGKVSYCVPKSTAYHIYYIEAYAPGYLMHEVKVNSLSSVVKVVITLQKYPPPSKLHAINAVVMDSQRHPIRWASLLVFDTSRNNLQNLNQSEMSDRNGRITIHVPVRDGYYLRAVASGYSCPEIKQPYNSQTVFFVLSPLPMYHHAN